MTLRGACVLLALGVAYGLAGCGSPQPQARPPLPVPSASEPSRAASSSASSSQVAPSSPTSPGAASPAASASAGPSATPTTPSRARPATDAPLIVVDPGHSGRFLRSVDRATGLRDIDYPNYPEIYEMFDVGSCAGAALRADGYRVTLTKRHALDSVGLAARARIADEGHAALAVSLHDDHSQGPGFQATYSQRGVRHDGAYHAMYRGSGRSWTVFSDPAVARASERAAATIARARTTAQGRPVGVRENDYTGRAPLEPGNLAIVQLLAHVPWVYDEAGARTGGSTTRAMSIATEQAYAEGLVVGVEAAVPLAPGRVAQPSAGVRALHGCLVTAATPGDGRVTRPARYRPAGS